MAYMKQLLPCPFCGKEPEIDKYKIKGIMHWNVGCMNDHCLVHVETDDFESKDEAIGAWNKRAT
jgi:Lar family restriction alleviation protein